MGLLTIRPALLVNKINVKKRRNEEYVGLLTIRPALVSSSTQSSLYSYGRDDEFGAGPIIGQWKLTNDMALPSVQSKELYR